MTTRRARWTGGLGLSLIGAGGFGFGLVAVPLAAAQGVSPTADPVTRSLSAQPAVSAPSGSPAAGAPQLSSAHSTPVTMAPAPTAPTRGVVELFTSQGCSSCPAADRVVSELKADPSLVVVSLPITYWDYLGWKDTLADPRHTARQKAYSHVRGDRAVYTPQVVINGVAHVLGSDKGAIESAVTQGRRGAALSLPVRLSVADGRVSVSAEPLRAPAVASSAPTSVPATTGEVWLLGLSSAVQVAVGRGENSGRNIVYSNVVRRWVKLGDWTGTTRSWSLPVAEIKTEKIDAVAVLVQGGTAKSPGPIYGAAFQRLN